MNRRTANDLKHHFDDLADEAPTTAVDTLVQSARRSGDRFRRRQALLCGVGALIVTLTIGLGATQPWTSERQAPPTAGETPGAPPSEPTVTTPGNAHSAGTSWRLLSQSAGGGREVEYYDTVEDLFSAAPLLVRGTVTQVDFSQLIDDPQVDQPYRDILLTITPIEEAGQSQTRSAPVVVQMGPFFGPEAEDWVKQMTSGPAKLLGDEAIWALRPRDDGPTYRPLTSDSVFVRNGDAVLTALAGDTPIRHETESMTWQQLVRSAELTA